MSKNKKSNIEKCESLLSRKLKKYISDENTYIDVLVSMQVVLSHYERCLLNQTSDECRHEYFSALIKVFNNFFETAEKHEPEINVIEIFSIMICILNKYLNDFDKENNDVISEREQRLRYLAIAGLIKDFYEPFDRDVDLYRRAPKYPETLALREARKNEKK